MIGSKLARRVKAMAGFIEQQPELFSACLFCVPSLPRMLDALIGLKADYLIYPIREHAAAYHAITTIDLVECLGSALRGEDYSLCREDRRISSDKAIEMLHEDLWGEDIYSDRICSAELSPAWRAKIECIFDQLEKRNLT